MSSFKEKLFYSYLPLLLGFIAGEMIYKLFLEDLLNKFFTR